MHDIKIPNPQGGKKSDFEVTQVSPSEARAPEPEAKGPWRASGEPSEKVRVKFEKFVQLVATHDFEDVMKRHAEEDIILSTNLLTDLANAHEEQEPQSGKKLPIIFIIGIIIGVVLTYLVIRF